MKEKFETPTQLNMRTLLVILLVLVVVASAQYEDEVEEVASVDEVAEEDVDSADETLVREKRESQYIEWRRDCMRGHKPSCTK